ncbi:MAG: hypothetical protein WAN48_08180 [Actinomycetes bacterium]
MSASGVLANGRRAGAGMVLLVVLATVLSGCFTAAVDLTINSDDTVSGQAVIAVDKSVVRRSGPVDNVVADLVDRLVPSDPPSGSVTTQPYREGDRVGVRVELVDVGLDAFGGGAGSKPPLLQITRSGQRYLVTGQVDLTPASLGVAQDAKARRLLTQAEVSLRIRFPGPVTSTNGQVSASDDQTVVWRFTMGAKTDIVAAAQANQSVQSVQSVWTMLTMLTRLLRSRWVLAGVAVTALAVVGSLALLVWWAVRSRRRTGRTHGRHVAQQHDR